MISFKKATIAATAAFALCSGAFAADVTYTCTGADDAGIAAALGAAGAGGSVAIDGACVTTLPVLVNIDVTISGANATACKSAPVDSISNTGAGGVIELLQGASGTTIEGLIINAGATHGIANGPLAGPFPLHQPDNVTLNCNQINAGPGRCVSQYSHNGPPFNDSSACDSVTGVPFCATPSGPGGPVGICTGWSITDNICDTQNGTGIMITGNNNTISGNDVTSGDECFRIQNNSCSSVPSVIAFGSAPGGSSNSIVNNTCDNALDPAEGGYAIAYIGLGFDFFTTEPQLSACQGNFGGKIDGNCITVSDPTDTAGFSACFQVQKENFLDITNNDCTALIPPSAFGNAGVVNFDTNNSSFSDNRMSGVDDYGLLALNGTEVSNTYANNQMSQGDIGIPFYPLLIVGPGPDFVDGNEWCDGSALIFSDVVGDIGTAGLWCAQVPDLPQPADCTKTDSCSSAGGKVEICHIPPGNPGNAHTISVGASAVPHHVANHGDTLGACSPANLGAFTGGSDLTASTPGISSRERKQNAVMRARQRLQSQRMLDFDTPSAVNTSTGQLETSSNPGTIGGAGR